MNHSASAAASSLALPESVAGPHGFAVGCNYWGSKSGVRMWREDEWDASSIAADLDALAAQGVEMLRVFPTWCDFQPLSRYFGYAGIPLGFVQDGTDRRIVDPLWLEPGAVARFRDFAAMANERGLRLMVSLVTGWMSGRLFAPRMVEGLDLVDDPAALMWEGRFARAFVRATRDLPAIVAWDLGNEFNCMGKIGSAEKAWLWIHTIASAIRLEDPTRPVASGMQAQTTNAFGPQYDKRNDWTLQMHGELVDILTPHPYPVSAPLLASRGPFNSFRNTLHPVSQCLLHESVSGKPAFPQEIGSLGPRTCPERVAAAGMRQQLFASWQHGLGAYLWWCAFDQMHLGYPPFNDNAMERELGILCDDAARTPKPQALTLKAFCKFRESLPFDRLPPRRIDGVCLVSEREEFCQQTFGAVMLSKAAGIDLQFIGSDSRPLPDSPFYVLPSGNGVRTWSQELWEGLLDKVRGGATLLATLGDGAGLSGWTAATGLERTSWNEARKIEFDFEGAHLSAHDTRTAVMAPAPEGGGCEVLARDAGGNVAVTRSRLGKGLVLFVNFALEKIVADGSAANAADSDFSNPLWRLYAWAAREAGVRRLVAKSDPRLLLTEHPGSAGCAAGGASSPSEPPSTLVCALNTCAEETAFALDVRGRVGRVWNGAFADGRLTLPANDGCVFEVL